MMLRKLFHPPRRALFVDRPHRPHEGEGRRRHQQHRPLQRTLLFRLDADRDRRDRALLGHSLGARTVEPAMAPIPIVQTTRTWNGPSHGVGDRRGSGSAGDLLIRR
jgi:hypothetical protein